jgi:hypothetical protein
MQGEVGRRGVQGGRERFSGGTIASHFEWGTIESARSRQLA